MSIVAGFLLAIAILLLLDASGCLLAPQLRSHLAWQRAMQTDEQVAIRGRWLLAASALLLFGVGALR